uniref:Uncharacterized protein n=1 Tax=Romanomermis culicivorax TaxID=13658 RepID=A0A915JQF2_ROMCU
MQDIFAYYSTFLCEVKKRQNSSREPLTVETFTREIAEGCLSRKDMLEYLSYTSIIWKHFNKNRLVQTHQ